MCRVSFDMAMIEGMGGLGRVWIPTSKQFSDIVGHVRFLLFSNLAFARSETSKAFLALVDSIRQTPNACLLNPFPSFSICPLPTRISLPHPSKSCFFQTILSHYQQEQKTVHHISDPTINEPMQVSWGFRILRFVSRDIVYFPRTVSE